MEDIPYHPKGDENGPPVSVRRDLQPTSDQFTGKIDGVRQHESLASARDPQPPPSASVVRPSFSSVRRPQCSNIFISETAWPMKAKCYVEPPWVGGTKFCSRHLGHMTKMAATPIFGKNHSKIFFSRTGRRISTKLGM